MADNRPSSQIDLERRRAAGHNPKKLAEGLDGTSERTSYKVEGNDTRGYIGVSPEYATYASDIDKPIVADEGVEAEARDALIVPDRVNKIEKPRDSTQIEGTGSAEPSIYSQTSGKVWPTEEVKGEEAPTTVKGLLGESDEDGDDEPEVEEVETEQSVAPPPVQSPPAAPQGNAAPGKGGKKADDAENKG